MNKPLLNDASQFPTEQILQSTLNESYTAYHLLLQQLTENNLIPEWRYYKDGGAWLCKVVDKKKTVFWLSAWPNYFKTTFYFTEKNCNGLFELGLSPKILYEFTNHPPIGKLKPLTLEINSPQQLQDLQLIIQYKSKQK